LNKTSLFAIELGDKNHFASRVREMFKEVKNGKAKLVPGNIIRWGDGRKLSEKFYEHFKRPTTPPSLVPEIIYRQPAGYVGHDWGKLYHDKDCKIRHTPKTTYPLGNITDGELLIQFTLWTGTDGKKAIVEVFNGVESIIKLYTSQTMITHTFKGKLVRGVRQQVNLLGIGASFTATLRLTKYYVWSEFSSNRRGSERSVFKYWSDKWWNGGLFKGKGSNTLKIFGDFVTLSTAYKHVVDKGQVFDLPTVYNENVTFKFYCKYKGELAEIRLLSNSKIVLDWSTVASGIQTKDGITKEERTTLSTFFQSGKTKAFELNIIANKTGIMTKYVFEINGAKYPKNTITSSVPTWKIDQIKVTGNIQDVNFLDSTSEKCLQVKEYKLPSNIAKTNKKLVEGDQIIIKGTVPNPFNETTITVCLMHRALEVTEHIGEIIYILYIYSNYSDNTAFVNGNWSQNERKDFIFWVAGAINNASNSVNLRGGERIRISIKFSGMDIKPFVETENAIIQNRIEYTCTEGYGYDLIEYIEVGGLEIIDGTELIRIRRKLR
uniref:Galectin n=1 Tax=Meloidogyne floridensis TaxID=298350 RepID=A0A915NQ04_9BILA